MLKKNTLILVGVFAALLTVTLLLQRNRELNPPEPDADLPTSPAPVYLSNSRVNPSQESGSRTKWGK
ncbi:MAG: hypothetical protein HC806_09905 [Anaerolineae bacterium]|nr:hypothetical protein [Anaerolineae bacterium]